MKPTSDDLVPLPASTGAGQPGRTEKFFPLVYTELRRLAAVKMAQQPLGHTLQPTAPVHEAWLRLERAEEQTWENRGHFFAAAAEAMRRILVENARRKKRLKRGGQLERVDIETVDLSNPMPDDDLLAVDEALDNLAKVNGRAAEVVKLCFFVGLTHEQAAKSLGVSVATVERSWQFARAWLFRELQQKG